MDSVKYLVRTAIENKKKGSKLSNFQRIRNIHNITIVQQLFLGRSHKNQLYIIIYK